MIQPPSHLHKTEQRTPALKHLQSPLQAFLQPQCSSMRQAVLTSSSLVHTGLHTFSKASNCHPQFENSGTSCSGIVERFQMKQARSMDRFRCSRNASLVGGSNSKHLSPLVNICSLASYTKDTVQVLLY